MGTEKLFSAFPFLLFVYCSFFTSYGFANHHIKVGQIGMFLGESDDLLANRDVFCRIGMFLGKSECFFG